MSSRSCWQAARLTFAAQLATLSPRRSSLFALCALTFCQATYLRNTIPYHKLQFFLPSDVQYALALTPCILLSSPCGLFSGVKDVIASIRRETRGYVPLSAQRTCHFFLSSLLYKPALFSDSEARQLSVRRRATARPRYEQAKAKRLTVTAIRMPDAGNLKGRAYAHIEAVTSASQPRACQHL